MEFEPMDDFERELREALERRPAPPGLKRKIFERRDRKRAERYRSLRIFGWEPATALVAAMAVVVVVAAGTGGLLVKRQMEEQRKGEEAKQQVLTALRITGHALQQMNRQLVERKGEMQ